MKQTKYTAINCDGTWYQLWKNISHYTKVGYRGAILGRKSIVTISSLCGNCDGRLPYIRGFCKENRK